MPEWKYNLEAKTGTFGSNKWRLMISDDKKGLIFDGEDFPCPGLATSINNQDEFHKHKCAKDYSNFDYPKVSKKIIADLWINIIEWGQLNNTNLKAFVAHINPLKLKIFDKTVIPKDTYGDLFPKDFDATKDGEISHIGNLNIGKYDSSGKNYGDEGFVFHLSTYDVNLTGNAKDRTVYINLDPKKHKREIYDVFSNAKMIFLPSLTFYSNMRSIIFPE